MPRLTASEQAYAVCVVWYPLAVYRMQNRFHVNCFPLPFGDRAVGRG
jgi:hypothetical protein